MTHNTEIHVRKRLLITEDTLREVGRELETPLKKICAIAVIEGDFSRFSQDLQSLIALGEQLGREFGAQLTEAVGAGQAVRAYGKAAVVGSACEIEHGAAILHPKLGGPLRAAIGGGKALIPSTIKRGGLGSRIDVPLHCKDDEWQFDYLDAMEAGVPDAPNANEIVVMFAVSCGVRPLARLG